MGAPAAMAAPLTTGSKLSEDMMFIWHSHRGTALALIAGCLLSISALGEARATETEDAPSTRQILGIFEQIAQTPRCSKHEDRISKWLLGWAKQRSLSARTDDHRNVIITVPASEGFEALPTIVLQAHMDMVCQKTEGSSHDFNIDPIVPIRDGDWLRAKDTTLGADDGIGVAIALALAEDPAAAHPKLELLFTVDEEVDMTGAGNLASDFFSGTRLINLDSEKEGVVTLGAAGGIKLDISLLMSFAPLEEEDTVFALRIDGLLGGHSGIDIDKGRSNANILLAQSLSTIPLRLISFSGGTADNVITRSSEAVFAVGPAQRDGLRLRIAAIEQEIRKQFPREEEFSITFSRIETKPFRAAVEVDSRRAIDLIGDLPQGVHEWSTEFPGLPETSGNVGIVRIEDDTLRVTVLPRSFSPVKLETIASLIEANAAKVGAEATRRSRYPAWPPLIGSELYRKSLSVYERLFQIPMRTEAIHAGLETGYFAERVKNMEIISIGPTLENVHTPRERLYVPSLEKVLRFLSELLRDLDSGEGR